MEEKKQDTTRFTPCFPVVILQEVWLSITQKTGKKQKSPNKKDHLAHSPATSSSTKFLHGREPWDLVLVLSLNTQNSNLTASLKPRFKST